MNKQFKFDIEDIGEPFELELSKQPPLVKTIEEIFKQYPCPNIVYAWAILLQLSGWSERCMNFKLQQVAHYCDDTVRYRDFILKKYYNNVNSTNEELKSLQEEKKYAENKHNELFELTEKHLFPDHHKRKFNDDEVVNDQPPTLEPILESKENWELNLY